MVDTIVQTKKGLTSFGLKYIALALMVLDHIHYFFEFTGWIPEWFSMLGRLSAPLFLFCVVEGFLNTHDRKKYFMRIYAIAIGMGLIQFAFYLLSPMVRPDGFFPRNAVFQNFVILIVILQGFEWCKEKKWGRGLAAILLPLAWPFVVSGFFAFFPQAALKVGFFINLLHFSVMPIATWISDGGGFFILEGILLYLLHKHRKVQAAAFFCANILMYGVACYFLMPELTIPMMFTKAYEWYGSFAFILMLMYNGERGRGFKSLFYWFYPAHIYVLYALSFGLFVLIK